MKKIPKSANLIEQRDGEDLYLTCNGVYLLASGEARKVKRLTVAAVMEWSRLHKIDTDPFQTPFAAERAKINAELVLTNEVTS